MHDRRQFLFTAFKSTISLTSANLGVYIVGSAFKTLDGSLVAGAKYVGACTCGILPPDPDSCSAQVAAAQAAYPTHTCYQENTGCSGPVIDQIWCEPP